MLPARRVPPGTGGKPGPRCAAPRRCGDGLGAKARCQLLQLVRVAAHEVLVPGGGPEALGGIFLEDQGKPKGNIIEMTVDRGEIPNQGVQVLGRKGLACRFPDGQGFRKVLELKRELTKYFALSRKADNCALASPASAVATAAAVCSSISGMCGLAAKSCRAEAVSP